MASKADIAERLSPADAADDYLEKPFFLKDATRRIKRMIDRIALEKMAKTAPSDGVVRGSLAQMNVIDLMQSLEMGRKSCQLSLSNEGDKCEVFFVEGQVKHATYGTLVGDRGCVQGAALDRRKFSARLRRQDRQRDHATQHARPADGRPAPARRIFARRRRRARAGGGARADQQTLRRPAGIGCFCPAPPAAVANPPLRAPSASATDIEGKKRKMSSSMAEPQSSHSGGGHGQRFLRSRGTRRSFRAGGGPNSAEASFRGDRARSCSRRFHPNSESAHSAGAGSAV